MRYQDPYAPGVRIVSVRTSHGEFAVTGDDLYMLATRLHELADEGARTAWTLIAAALDDSSVNAISLTGAEEHAVARALDGLHDVTEHQSLRWLALGVREHQG